MFILFCLYHILFTIIFGKTVSRSWENTVAPFPLLSLNEKNASNIHKRLWCWDEIFFMLGRDGLLLKFSTSVNASSLQFYRDVAI